MISHIIGQIVEKRHKFLFAENAILGVSAARSSVCSYKAIAAIDNPSNKSCISNVTFVFHR